MADQGGDVLDNDAAERALFPARGLPGGGQLEVRMEISANHPDPDIRRVGRKVKPYNLESWYSEWSAVAENVGVTTNRSQAGALSLQDLMYNETPPNDGHRRNILSSSYTEVGVDVVEDSAHGKIWLVTDFGRP